MHAAASAGGTIGAQVPDAGIATRGKRKRTHRAAADAKRRREAAAAFAGTERTVTKTVRPLRARPPFPPRRWKSLIIIWMWVNIDIQTGNKCIVCGK